MGRPRRIPVTENSRHSLSEAHSMLPSHSGAPPLMSSDGSAHVQQTTHSRATSIPSTHNRTDPEPTASTDESTDESDDDISTSDEKDNGSKKTGPKNWIVDLIDDDDGSITQQNLKVKDIWTLPVGRKVIVRADESGEPIDDAGGILAGFLGLLGSDYSKLPICYATWPKVPKEYKNKVYDGIIKKKFHIVDDRVPKVIMEKIGRRWSGTRLKLYKRFHAESLSMEENVRRRPSGIDAEQWAWYLQHRKNKKTQEMCKTNAENQKKQVYTYTGGSKSISRRKAEEERKCGKTISRREISAALRKRKRNGLYDVDAADALRKRKHDGSYDEDAADALRKRKHDGFYDEDAADALRKQKHDGSYDDDAADALREQKHDGSYDEDAAEIVGGENDNIERLDGSSESNSQDDSVAMVLRKERDSLVKDAGNGSSPAQMFGHTTHQCGGTSPTPVRDSKMDEMKSGFEAEKSKRRELELVVDAEKSKRQELELVVDAEKSKRRELESMVDAEKWKRRELESVVDAEKSKRRELESVVDAEKSKRRELESVLDAEKSKRQELESVVDAEKSKVRMLESVVDAEKSKVRMLESVVDAEKSKVQKLDLVVDAEKSKMRNLEMLVVHLVKQGGDLPAELAANVSAMYGSEFEDMPNSACQMPTQTLFLKSANFRGRTL